jgi:hypothetical protein
MHIDNLNFQQITRMGADAKAAECLQKGMWKYAQAGKAIQTAGQLL